MGKTRMTKREATLLNLVRRVSHPLDVEFGRSPGGPYRLRILRKREVLIEVSSRSLERIQYQFAAAIVSVKRSGMVPEFQIARKKLAA